MFIKDITLRLKEVFTQAANVFSIEHWREKNREREEILSRLKERKEERKIANIRRSQFHALPSTYIKPGDEISPERKVEEEHAKSLRKGFRIIPPEDEDGADKKFQDTGTDGQTPTNE